MNKPISLLNWILLALLVGIWGGSFVAIKIAITDMGPAWLAATRIFLATLLMIIYARFFNIRPPKGRREWQIAAILGVIGTALPFALIGWASKFVPSGIAGLMMATNPMIVLILAMISLPEEPPTRTRLAGIAIGFWGVGLVILGRPHNQITQIGATPQATLGFDWALLAYIALLLGTFGYAINNVVSRKATHMPHATRGFGALLTATPAAIILAAFSEPLPDVFSLHAPAISAIIYLAILPTWIATLLLYRLIAHTSASFVAQSNYLVPATAIALGAWILGEHLTPLQYGGFVLILMGIAIAEQLFTRFLRNTP